MFFCRYCNSLSLVDKIVDDNPDSSPIFKIIIPRLIKEIKDRTDMCRKRSAITMAKLAKDPVLKEEIRKLNGIDLLLKLHNLILN